MKETYTSQLAIRIDNDNQNHHLWNNNGTWFIHFTHHPNKLQAQRIRRSLKVHEARLRRDQFFGSFKSNQRQVDARLQKVSFKYG